MSPGSLCSVVSFCKIIIFFCSLISPAHLACSPRLLACLRCYLCRCGFSHCQFHLLHLRFYSPWLQPDGLKVFAPHAGILRKSSKRVKGPLLSEPLREYRRQMPSYATPN